MNEEGQVVEPTEQEVVQQTQPELSEIELKALEQGWKPKDEWEGNEGDWRPAKEFVERGELFTKISHQSQEIKELRKSLNYLVDHHKKVKETEFNRALTQLKTMKKEALTEGDPDKVVEIDDAIQTLRDQQREANSTSNEVVTTSTQSETFLRFVQENPWYVTDKEMKAFADEIGIGIFNARGGKIAENDLHAEVIKRVKKQFPEKFSKRTTLSAPQVEGSSSTGNSSKSAKDYPLTEDERKTMMTFVRQGVMTKEEYISELKKIKGEE